MANITKDLGVATAYGYHKAGGGTLTEAEFEQKMVDITTAAGDAEAYGAGTRGGTAVPSTDDAYHNNAKYYKEQAEQSAQSISQSATQIATNTSDITDLKADITEIQSDVAEIQSDGVVPTSRQLLSDKYAVDEEPYKYRASYSGDRMDDEIVGGSIVWNQLLNNMRGNSTEKGLTFVNNNSALTITGTITEAFSYNYVMLTNNRVPFKRDGSKYILTLNKEIPFAWGVNGYGPLIPASNRAGMWTNSSGGVWTNGLVFRAEVGQTVDISQLKASIFNLTAMFGTEVADYIYGLEQATAGAGVAYFKKLFPNGYYPYNSGELISVSGLSAHNMVGFNQFDKSTVLNGYIIDDANGDAKPVSSGKATDYIPVIPKQTYYIKSDQTSGAWGSWYDADKNYISGITGYSQNSGNASKTAPVNARYMRLTCVYNGSGDLDTFCINLSDPARNGEYEPYVKHSYPLDSDLTLRGIPKLGDKGLYFDGDTYESDGTVTRRYGIVDLGTLSWSYIGNAGAERFYSSSVDIKPPSATTIIGNVICPNYITIAQNRYAQFIDDKIVCVSTASQLIVRDTAYTDVETFKAAMSGVYLVYELATPTIETATPYTALQTVDASGTEEYVSTSIVPVGHYTKYYDDLRKKLDGLPWNLGMIAPEETGTTASQAYVVGKYFLLNHQLCKAKTAIASGATFTLNTNYEVTTVADELYTALHA